MKANPPRSRRTFAGVWDEIQYLRELLLFWLYERENPRKARRYGGRLRTLLGRADPRHEAILAEECRSLMSEAEGDEKAAIAHRETEILLIRRLHQIARGNPHDRAALEGYGPEELRDRLTLLAILYHDHAQLDKAIETLEDSRQFCRKNGIEFEDDDLLEEYSAERVARGARMVS